MAYVELDSASEIVKRLGLDENGNAMSYLTATCQRYMDDFVPKDTGILRETVELTPTTITYTQPYASYQYYGMRADGSKPVTNYTTPGTGPYWDKQMVSAKIDDVIEEVENYMKGKA